jgi:peptidylprolyl isomerase
VRRRALVGLLLLIAACQQKGAKHHRDAGATADAGPRGQTGQQPARAPQIKPPLPVARPPADAEELKGIEGAPSSVIRIKRLTPGTGEHPGRNDTVSINFTGWRTTGETFLTTTVRKRPVQQSLARLAPGFAAAVVSMKKGERAMMWIPPELGYLGPPSTVPEVTVYEVELVDIEAGPATPPDVAAPPPDAKKTSQGVAYEIVKPGTGTEKPTFQDLVQYNYSAWMANGRLVDSSVVIKQPKQTFVFREPPAMEEVLRALTVGAVARVWMPEAQIEMMPPLAKGTLTYEIELLGVKPMKAPPPVPPDVAAPPANATKTANGAFYRRLKKGTGTVKPRGNDRLKIEYTGWTTAGRLFDSSIVRGEPAVVQLDRMIKGWTEGLSNMVAGEKIRLWLPPELTFQNEPGNPQGMLVFDLELVEILPPPSKPGPATR